VKHRPISDKVRHPRSLMARVCWRLNGREDRGSPVSVAFARDWVEHLNEKYGVGTHWFEFVND